MKLEQFHQYLNFIAAKQCFKYTNGRFKSQLLPYPGGSKYVKWRRKMIPFWVWPDESIICSNQWDKNARHLEAHDRLEYLGVIGLAGYSKSSTFKVIYILWTAKGLWAMSLTVFQYLKGSLEVGTRKGTKRKSFCIFHDYTYYGLN